MQTLRLNDTGYAVKSVQKKLKRLFNAHMPENGIFDQQTKKFVQLFQSTVGETVDGIVGPKTWLRLLSFAYDFHFNENIEDLHLPTSEYVPQLWDKRTIYLHHTVGGCNPYHTRRWWLIDKKHYRRSRWRVATAFIIGRSADTGRGMCMDGKILRVFPERYWAYHLGLQHPNNTRRNAESIGIELCNLGPLEKKGSKFFKVWRDRRGSIEKQLEIPKTEVCDLGYTWRKHQYFHRYSDKQLQECKQLILRLCELYQIPIRDFVYSKEWFQYNQNAMNGQPGIWTHVNVRRDKTDCYPCPRLIKMLNDIQPQPMNYTVATPPINRTPIDEKLNTENLRYAFDDW